jgi:hypothetical protein
MTPEQPASLSISAEMSPVWAPLASLWQSWPPSLMGLDATSRTIGAISVAGGQIMTSQRTRAPDSISISRSTSSSDAMVPFIFQFPATSGRGPRSAMLATPWKIRWARRACRVLAGATAAPL